MGRLRTRLKNVIVTGIIICCLMFVWMLGIAREGKHGKPTAEPTDGPYQALLEVRFTDLRDKLQKAELTNRQRMNDLQMLRSQFSYLVQVMAQNKTNSTYHGDLPSLLQSGHGNLSDQIGSVHLPSIFTYLPHLTGHPDSLKPIYKLSKDRMGTSIVIGIPTIRRDKVDYLSSTVKSLIEGLSLEEQSQCLIVVFVAEPWDLPYAKEVGNQLQTEFPEAVSQGLLEVIAPPPDFYPDMNNLKLTFGDTKERVRWRTKQNLDFSFLMLYARTRGYYYVQLEDDVISKPGYFSIMKTYSDQQKGDDWVLLEFSTLGFIGKLFKSSQIPVIVEFFLMFHKDKPIDWLLDHYLSVKVCSPEKDAKHCSRMKGEARKRFKPSLFQHVGTQSSLKGKTQKLKDKDFGKQAIYRAHVNPEAVVSTTIKAYQKYFIKKAYIGEDVFWGVSPSEGDTLRIEFSPPLKLASFLFRSGNANHPDDKFHNTNVEVQVEDEVVKYITVGNFTDAGVASGTISPDIGKVKVIRLKVLESSPNWVILSEIHIVPSTTR